MTEGRHGAVRFYAGLWSRVGAYLIDFIIVNAIALAIYFVPGFVYHAATGGLGDIDPAPNAFAVVILVLSILAAVAYPVCFWRWRGQTPGKMAVGLRVVTAGGSPPSWGSALLRFLGYVICWATVGLLFLWIVFDDRKRGLHDRMAGTFVVKLPRRGVLLSEAYEAR